MTTTRRTLIAVAAASLFAALAFAPLHVAAQGGSRIAIRGAKIVTGAGATIDSGTIVMRDGLIESVAAGGNAPADATVIDGAGLTVYPGLIDMANGTVLDMPAPESAGATAGRGAAPAAGGRGGRGAETETYADLERAKRAQILRPDFEAAEVVRYEGPELARLASAGITSVLAVPTAGLFRGQSALINVAAPASGPEVSTVGRDRHGLVVVKAPVAEHVTFDPGRGGGPNAYPGSLLGVVAFIRQSFYDAVWQRDARAYYTRHADAPRPAFEPALDALAPALAGKMPVAFDAAEEREILRALGLAKEFSLDPIIVGGLEASSVIDDLRAVKARVIYSVNFQAGGRGGGPGADVPIRTMHLAQNAPTVPAALDKAGIVFAFTSAGLATPADFVRNVARTVKEGGLPADAALRALTSNAAKIAGVGDRLGTIEKGKIANLLVTEGDLFDNGRVRYVFVDGRSVSVGQ
ncbi:MAG TPA: amidohydrolase family protein [Vicinamibacterales bacterium]|nr:amidohydrolase family protein [Vicinamibacterales bacterium]